MKKPIQTKQQAIDQVIANNPDDYSRLLSFAETWVKSQGKAFDAEDLKQAFDKAGHAPVSNLNIIGSVFNTLSRRKAIFFRDWGFAELPAAHGRGLRLWISLEYRLKQQKNARIDHQTLQLFTQQF